MEGFLIILHPGTIATIRRLPSESISRVEGLAVGRELILPGSLRNGLENIRFQFRPLIHEGEKWEFDIFPTRIQNALRRVGIRTFEQLDQLSEGQLLTIEQIGTKCVSIILTERSARKQTS